MEWATYLCEDGGGCERTSGECGDGSGGGAGEREHCGGGNGGRGGEGSVYICKRRARNGNQAPPRWKSAPDQQISGTVHLPALSLMRRAPPGDVYTYPVFPTLAALTCASLHQQQMLPDNSTIIDPVGPPHTPTDTPADPQRCKLLGTTGLVVQALSKHLSRLRFSSHNSHRTSTSGHPRHRFFGR